MEDNSFTRPFHVNGNAHRFTVLIEHHPINRRLKSARLVMLGYKPASPWHCMASSPNEDELAIAGRKRRTARLAILSCDQPFPAYSASMLCRYPPAIGNPFATTLAVCNVGGAATSLCTTLRITPVPHPRKRQPMAHSSTTIE
jgi:hypothetical protein